MRHSYIALFVILLALSGCTAPGVEEAADPPGEAGIPDLVADDIVSHDRAEELAHDHLQDGSQGLLDGVDEVRTLDVEVDDMGQSHVRVQQFIDGVPVHGGEAIVHLDRHGRLLSLSDHFARHVTADTRPAVSRDDALGIVSDILGGLLGKHLEGLLELLVLPGDGDDDDRLAYRVPFAGQRLDGTPTMPVFFIDAITGQVLASFDQLQTALDRRTHDAGNSTDLPGTLVRSEGEGRTGDAEVDGAHDNAGIAHEYFRSVFGRDSHDDRGATLSSTVHFGQMYNNAFWNGRQMVYGDGDGITFAPLSRSLDVTTHELGHAVTASDSRLIYRGESGALNEAMSDIFAAAAQVWVDDGRITDTTWKLADDVYTPLVPGDALRYMDDPARAGDADFYPDRYTGPEDNGGVHVNSGIANLAFVLLARGGDHPRGKTQVTVPAIGVGMSAAIFYRANTTYLTPQSTFADAREATAQAAGDLYGPSEVEAVHLAWDAVGVPGRSDEPTPPGRPCADHDELHRGFIAVPRQSRYEPEGRYVYSETGELAGCLRGPGNADFELSLLRWNGLWWVPVAESTGGDASEEIAFSGEPGYYAWRIHARSGRGAYAFGMNR